MSEPIRIILVDDHAMLREALRQLLSREPDLQVVAEATDARTTYQVCEETPADIVLLDLVLPGAGGLMISRELKRRFPNLKVLFFSGSDADDFIVEALSAGAEGYVDKSQPVAELIAALRMVAAGQVYLSPRISRALLVEHLQRRTGEKPSGGVLDVLSPREREVFDLLIQGHTSQRIAEQLFISTRTVETHRAHIMRKVGVRSTPELFRLAAKLHLLADDPHSAVPRRLDQREPPADAASQT